MTNPLSGDPFNSMDVARINLPKHLKIEPLDLGELDWSHNPALRAKVARAYTVSNDEGFKVACFDVVGGSAYGLVIGEHSFPAKTSWHLVSLIKAAFRKTGSVP